MSEESGEKVPLWIISFADMITLLLSFFVMLQTMAKSQDAALFGASRESFRRSIDGLGIPDMLLGKQTGANMDFHKLKYPYETDEEDPYHTERVIDPQDDKIRAMFQQLQQSMHSDVAPPAGAPTTLATPIRFESGQAELDEKAREYLKTLAGDLHGGPGGWVGLRITGYADPAEQDRAAAMILAARRASAVQQRLEELLANEVRAGKVHLSSRGAVALAGAEQQGQIIIAKEGQAKHGR